jgi:hypothetical protein
MTEKQDKKRCRCFIHHPRDEEERKVIGEALDYARRIGDTGAIPLIIAQLTTACPGLGK